MASCCMPDGRGVQASPPCAAAGSAADGAELVPRLATIPRTTFLMGNDGPDAMPSDGEGPVRDVTVSAFAIAATTVTNQQFAAFVRATRYVTDAERAGSSFVFFLQLPEARRRQVRRVAASLPWWLLVAGACWQRPEGPGSQVHERPDHPVVHVSWNDAMAYCAWAGLRLPTEAQWECAGRGGRDGLRFPWGNELCDGDVPRANVWRGEFPNRPRHGWVPGPVTATSGPPNDFGLHHMCGNVWEWCADAYSPLYHRATAAEDPLFDAPTGLRSMRGGSFLCHDSYCNRYRLAARHSAAADLSTSHIGFRVAGPAP